jgi:hypothetical protein
MKDAKSEFLNFTKRKKLLLLLTAISTTDFVSMLLVLTAISMAPYVSLVSATIDGAKPLFAFSLVMLLTLFLPEYLKEPTDRKTLATKLTATLLIIAGVVMVTAL